MFVVCAVACLVVDRDTVRARVRAAATGDGDRLPARARAAGGSPPAFLFGCACAVKWSGVWFLAFFAVLSLFWDRAAWREAGVRPPDPRRRCAAACPARPGRWAPSRCSPTWRRSPAGSSARRRRARRWAQQHPHTAFPFVPDALRSLWHEHARVADVPQRPVHARTRGSPAPGRGWSTAGRSCCGTRRGSPTPSGEQIVRYILMVGTPTLWFAFAPAHALAALADRRPPRPGGAHRRGRRSRAGWLTWFINLERTMFIFYMAPVAAVLRPGGDPRAAGRPRAGRTPIRCAGRSASARCASTSPCRGHLRLLLPGARRAAAAARASGCCGCGSRHGSDDRLARYIVGLYN